MARPRTQSRVPEHPEADAVTLQGILEALAEPVRRDIVRQLARADGDISCGAFGLTVARSTSTHHFNVLREAGLIRQYYVGTTKMNSLRRDDVERRYPGLLTALLSAADREYTESTVG